MNIKKSAKLLYHKDCKKRRAAVYELAEAQSLESIKNPDLLDLFIRKLSGSKQKTIDGFIDNIERVSEPAAAERVKWIAESLGIPLLYIADVIWSFEEFIGSANMRIAAAKVLGKLGDKEAVYPLIKALSDEYEPLRAAAADALGKIKDESALGPLRSALDDKDFSVRKAATQALREFEVDVPEPKPRERKKDAIIVFVYRFNKWKKTMAEGINIFPFTEEYAKLKTKKEMPMSSKYKAIEYFGPDEWSAPTITPGNEIIDMDIGKVKAAMVACLEQNGYDLDTIGKALSSLRIRPNPKLGVMHLIIDMPYSS